MKILAPIKSVYRQLKGKSLKQKLLYVVSLSGSPEHLAFSFALGIFLGLSPFYGIQIFLAFFIVYFMRLNLTAMMLGCLLNMPFIAPGVYLLCYKLGRKISLGDRVIPQDVLLDSMNKALQLQFSEISLSRADALIFVQNLFVGTTIAGIVLGIAGYFLMKQTILFHRNRKTQNPTLSEDSGSC